jgi:hypothetical protein
MTKLPDLTVLHCYWAYEFILVNSMRSCTASNTVYRRCGLPYPNDGRGFVGAKKKTSVGLLVFNPLRTPSLESLVEGQNWFLNQFVQIPRRSIIVCFLFLSKKAGLNLPPFEISCSWPPSPVSIVFGLENLVMHNCSCRTVQKIQKGTQLFNSPPPL